MTDATARETINLLTSRAFERVARQWVRSAIVTKRTTLRKSRETTKIYDKKEIKHDFVSLLSAFFHLKLAD